jgi:hypothetical protein
LSAWRRAFRRDGLAIAAIVFLVPSPIVAAACFVGIDESLLARDGGVSSSSGGGDAGGEGGAVDAGPAVVACGDAACVPPVSVCCADTFGDTDHTKGSCSQRNDCSTGDWFACVEAHDCSYAASAGPRCCIVRLQGGAFTQTVCSTDCDGGDALCAPDDGVGCLPGLACRASLEFPALDQCQR